MPHTHVFTVRRPGGTVEVPSDVDVCFHWSIFTPNGYLGTITVPDAFMATLAATECTVTLYPHGRACVIDSIRAARAFETLTREYLSRRNGGRP